MLYFILWVVFILAVILVVPIVNMIENKRRAALMPAMPAEEDWSEEDQVDEAFVDEPAEEATFDDGGGFGEAPVEELADFGGGEDFSAFDDEFK